MAFDDPYALIRDSIKKIVNNKNPDISVVKSLITKVSFVDDEIRLEGKYGDGNILQSYLTENGIQVLKSYFLYSKGRKTIQVPDSGSSLYLMYIGSNYYPLFIEGSSSYYFGGTLNSNIEDNNVLSNSKTLLVDPTKYINNPSTRPVTSTNSTFISNYDLISRIKSLENMVNNLIEVFNGHQHGYVSPTGPLISDGPTSFIGNEIDNKIQTINSKILI